MKRKKVNAIIKEYGYTKIKPSWFASNDGNGAIFNAYDEGGFCYSWYINWKQKRVRRQMLSDVQLLKTVDMTHMFWR